MPTLAIFSDPTLQTREYYKEVDSTTLVETIHHAYEDGMRFDSPMQIVVDGELVKPFDEAGEPIKGVLRMTLRPKSLVVVSPQVGDPTGGILTAILTIVSVAASVASVFLLKQPSVPERGLTSRSRYSFDGQTNRNRRGEPVERVYGQVKHWPSFGADFYLVGDQMYALYCIGEGKIDLIEARYENTPLDSVGEITYEWLYPDQQVTIFDQSITQLPDINNLEIKAAHVVGSANSTYGPYVVGDSGAEVTRIEMDMSYPLGWFWSNNSTGTSTVNMSYRVDTREIDDNGDPLTSWVQSYRNEAARYITSPWTQTVGFDMPAGRYEMRIVFDNVYSGSGRDPRYDGGGRYDSGGIEANFRDKVVVTRVRYTSTGVAQTYPHSTMMAVKFNATNAVNGDQHRKINVDCIAVTPQITKTVNGEGVTNYSFEDTPNRSIISAFCDIFRNQYGANLADEYLDLAALYAIEESNVAEGRFFDWVFDQKIGAWEAAGMVSKVCRGTPVIDGSIISMVTDGEVDGVVAYFSPYNIKDGSLSQSIKARTITDNTGLTIEYVDDTTGKQEQIVCLVADTDNETKLKKVIYAGQRDRDWAYRDGLTMRAKEQQVNKFVQFQTGREGFPLKLGDAFGLASDVTGIGDNFGQVLDITGTTMTLDTDVDLTSLTDPTVAIRTNNGGMSGPWGVTAGANAKQLILDNPIETGEITVASNAESPWFVVGDAVYEIYTASSIRPSGLDDVDVEGSIYDASVYAFDGLTAPVRNVTPTQPTIPDNPTVTNLEVTDLSLLSLTALATWSAALGARYYIVEVSRDGADWQRVDTTGNTFMRVPVVAGYFYVRVAGFNIGQGAWDVWSGELLNEYRPVVDQNGNIQYNENGDIQTWT